jgi:hypothetical protein
MTDKTQLVFTEPVYKGIHDMVEALVELLEESHRRPFREEHLIDGLAPKLIIDAKNVGEDGEYVAEIALFNAELEPVLILTKDTEFLPRGSNQIEIGRILRVIIQRIVDEHRRDLERTVHRLKKVGTIE